MSNVRWDPDRRTWVFAPTGRDADQVQADREAYLARELAAASAEDLARWAWNHSAATPARRVHRSWSRLDPDTVREIRALKGVLSHRAIASLYGVSHATVGSVLRGESWTDVT